MTVAYTQDDLDRDISMIDVGLEDIGIRVKRIRDNWAQVSHLHPGVEAVDYIRQHVPFLLKNTGAAVALVGSGMTVSDAARVTGRSHQAVSKATAKTRSATPVADRPTTLATGKAAPGPKVGTPKPAKPKSKPKPKPLIVVTGPTPEEEAAEHAARAEFFGKQMEDWLGRLVELITETPFDPNLPDEPIADILASGYPKPQTVRAAIAALDTLAKLMGI